MNDFAGFRKNRSTSVRKRAKIFMKQSRRCICNEAFLIMGEGDISSNEKLASNSTSGAGLLEILVRDPDRACCRRSLLVFQGGIGC